MIFGGRNGMEIWNQSCYVYAYGTNNFWPHNPNDWGVIHNNQWVSQNGDENNYFSTRQIVIKIMI